MFLSGLYGLSFKYLWPDAIFWNDQSIVFALAGMVFSGAMIAICFMKLNRDSGKSYFLLLMLALGGLALMGLSIVLPYRAALFMAVALALSTFIVGIPTVLDRWLNGFHPGRFFVLAWMALAFGAFILTMNKMGILPRSFFTENSTQIGSMIQVVLLSFSLADRLNLEKKEKIEAQNLAHEEEKNARIANERALLNEKLAREAREATYMIQKKGVDSLENEVRERTARLDETLAKVNEANQQIMSSLRYARMIQQAILPDMNRVKSLLPNSAVWWSPRDAVGGDFYFIDRIEEGVIVTVADCTGRGVAGAFMTIVAGSELKRIVKGEGCRDPGLILERLNKGVKQTLKQDVRRFMAEDGLDIGICVVNMAKKRMVYSGANIDLVCVVDGEIRTLKGERKSVGYVSTKNSDYSVQSLDIEKKTAVFIYTDGITDQLGERSGQRFGTRRLKDLIVEHARLPIPVQCEIIKASSEVYRGNRGQVDDMTLVAFEVKP
jgi:serine phosphatase RsbU (regulator of sigma subunit)